MLPFVDEKERDGMSRIAEKIPQLIAEAYGDKYDSKELSRQKLTEAVKEQQGQIEAQDSEMQQLKAENDGLKERISALENNVQKP